jgi:hypothetical protein
LVAPEPNPGAQTEEKPGNLLVLALSASLEGAAAGLLGASFGLCSKRPVASATR